MGNQSYILSREAVWNNAKAIVKRQFPDDTRLLIKGGNVESSPLPIDASLTELTFDFTHATYEEQVNSVVSQYLDLRRKQKVLHPSRAPKNKQEVMVKVRALG
jgi:hypothetical protein